MFLDPITSLMSFDRHPHYGQMIAHEVFYQNTPQMHVRPHRIYSKKEFENFMSQISYFAINCKNP